MIKRNIQSFCLGLTLALFFFIPSLMADTSSQVFDKKPLDHSWRKGESRLSGAQGNIEGYLADIVYNNPRIYQEIDALNYNINMHFNPGADPYPNNAYITAVSSIQAKAKTNILTHVVIDFYDNITITSLRLNGGEFINYSRSDNKIWLNLAASPLMPGEEFNVTIEYTCVIGGAWQGLLFRRHSSTGPSNPNGAQIFYSMNQPYMSPGWYPCFDYPGDKVTADIYITCPDWMVVVANGLLQPGYPIDNGDGTKTHYWKENYQIYTSVLAVNMTNYTTWSDTYISPLDGTHMPLTYYVFPEDETNARITFPLNKDALVFYAQKFGEYPFINEKYGVAEGANPYGSMEHQTITCLTFRSTRALVNWDVMVHELAHQWWGDSITCKTWNHVWVHEGFATYSEILFHEYYTGEPAGTFISANYDDGLYDGNLTGTVYVEDQDIGDPYGDEGSIYDKGGWVLHMLRHMLGDTKFFAVLHAYYQAHAYGNADTDDVRTSMEAQYGQSLVDFFNQWIYTPYRPVYSILYEKSGSSGNYTINVNLSQTQGHQIQDVSGTLLRNYYIMPVDFTVHYTDASSETFTFQNTSRNQSFQIHTVKEPDHIVFDEPINILKVKSESMITVTTTTSTQPTTTTSVQPTTTTTSVQTTTTTSVQSTVIELSSFTAAQVFGKVILAWTTESEIDNAGFNLLRAESGEGEYVKINAALIPARGSLTQGASYEFIDRDTRFGKSYWYKLEDIDLNGGSTMHGPVKAVQRFLFGLRGGTMQ
jgi:aminopeptidase N